MPTALSSPFIATGMAVAHHVGTDVFLSGRHSDEVLLEEKDGNLVADAFGAFGRDCADNFAQLLQRGAECGRLRRQALIYFRRRVTGRLRFTHREKPVQARQYPAFSFS